MMTIVWLTAAVIGIWSLAFKQYKCSIYVHFFCMGVLTIITWMSGFLAIVSFGVSGTEIGDFHVGLGIAIMCIMVVQCIGGLVSWALQKNSGVKPKTLFMITFAHRMLGWVLVLLGLIQLLVESR